MNRLMTFDKYRVFETEFAGRPLKVETGKMTQLANGACLVHYGDTLEKRNNRTEGKSLYSGNSVLARCTAENSLGGDLYG